MGRMKPGKPRRARPGHSLVEQSRAAASAYAAWYRCSHCGDSETGPPSADLHTIGLAHIDIRHDDGCPVMGGTVSDIPDAVRALEARREATGRGGVVMVNKRTERVLGVSMVDTTEQAVHVGTAASAEGMQAICVMPAYAAP
ncbi:hypothetical protein [Streptomyces sp. YIM B13508]|uniref:hypothetical protein n=1 Tax=Streptomyces sp. YIM B13508 TaxID=3366315 RepID=UPI0036925F25